MINPATTPEVRVAAYVFEQVFGSAPAAARRVPAALTLLDGWTVTLPWGAVAAADRTDGDTASVYSMNHYLMAPFSGMPKWIADPFASPAPGTRLLLNRELPEALGLLSGAETAQATTRALNDLHGRTNPPLAPPRPSAPDLRLLIIALPVGTPNASVSAPGTAPCDPAERGPALTAAHTFGDPVRDLALTAALDAGALGGRSIGACVVVLTPVHAMRRIRAAVTATLRPRVPRPPRYLTAAL